MEKNDSIRPDILMAFNQEDLDNAYKMNVPEVYLVGGTFTVPADRRHVVHLPIGRPTVVVEEPPLPPPAAPPPAEMPAAPEGEWRNTPDDGTLRALVRCEVILVPGSSSGSGSRLSSRWSSGSWRSSGSGRSSGPAGLAGLCGYGLELI